MADVTLRMPASILACRRRPGRCSSHGGIRRPGAPPVAPYSWEEEAGIAVGTQ